MLGKTSMIFHWRQWKWQTQFALLQEVHFCHLLPFARVGLYSWLPCVGTYLAENHHQNLPTQMIPVGQFWGLSSRTYLWIVRAQYSGYWLGKYQVRSPLTYMYTYHVTSQLTNIRWPSHCHMIKGWSSSWLICGDTSLWTGRQPLGSSGGRKTHPRNATWYTYLEPCMEKWKWRGKEKGRRRKIWKKEGRNEEKRGKIKEKERMKEREREAWRKERWKKRKNEGRNEGKEEKRKEDIKKER